MLNGRQRRLGWLFEHVEFWYTKTLSSLIWRPLNDFAITIPWTRKMFLVVGPELRGLGEMFVVLPFSCFNYVFNV